MLQLDEIFCPVDFSDATSLGIAAAESLAARFGARLVLVHVLPRLALPLRIPVEGEDVPSRWQVRAQERLRALAAGPRSRGVPTEILVRDGSALPALVRTLAERGSDVVVLPTHAGAGLDRWLHGSVAEGVMRTAATPVLAIPPEHEAARQFAPARILAATDFSVAAGQAIEHAAAWARAYASELTLAHVFMYQGVGPRGVEWVLPTLTKEQIEAAVAQATERLEQLANAARRQGGTVVTELSQSADCAGEIVRLAQEVCADLVVVGSHGHGLLHRLLLGSTTARLLRLCPCPLLSIPPPHLQGSPEASGLVPANC